MILFDLRHSQCRNLESKVMISNLRVKSLTSIFPNFTHSHQGCKFALRFSHFAKKCECDATNSHSHRIRIGILKSRRIRIAFASLKSCSHFRFFAFAKMRICAKIFTEVEIFSERHSGLNFQLPSGHFFFLIFASRKNQILDFLSNNRF